MAIDKSPPAHLRSLSPPRRPQSSRLFADVDPAFSRHSLDLVNKLLSIGVNRDVDLPLIVVLGSQSSGKSSLIEAISSIALPRQADTCTRVPIECRLSSSSEPWKCSIILQLNDANDRREIPFGDIITEDEDGGDLKTTQTVKERIRRAQMAILNPLRRDRDGPDSFLDTEDNSLQLSFSESAVCVEISGQDVPNLTFVDLPGLIQSVGSAGKAADIKLVEGLARRYVERKNSIILLTITCETDAANQPAYDLARKCDPEGTRTVGVLTKADRIDRGQELQWLKFLSNEREPLANGWFSVKQPNEEGLKKGTTREEALQQEKDFFEHDWFWARFSPTYEPRLGIKHVQENLEEVLGALISRRVPMLDEELTREYDEIEEKLRELPSLGSENPVGVVTVAIEHFLNQVKLETQPSYMGIPQKSTFRKEFRYIEQNFKKQIRCTAPNFKPWSRSKAEDVRKNGKDVLPPVEILREDDYSEDLEAFSGEEIYLDDVQYKAREARSEMGGLPDAVPEFVVRDYVTRSISSWLKPSEDLAQTAFAVLSQRLLETVDVCFGKYHEGGLDKKISAALLKHLQKRHEETVQFLTRTYSLERRGFTNNKSDFRRFKGVFKLHYRLHHEIAKGKAGVFENLGLKPYNPQASRPAPVPFQTSMEQAKTALNKIGIPVADTKEIVCMLVDDSTGPAIEVMANASAFFEVAYRRFTDYAPQIILQNLVDGALEGLREAINAHIELRGPEAFERCTKLLRESPQVAQEREFLQKKRQRLLKAKAQLREFQMPQVAQ